MNNINYFPLLLLISMIAFGCSEVDKPAKDNPDPETSVLPDNHEDFNSFYVKFGSDSVFQMSRIEFPLPGKPSTIDTIPEGTDLTSFVWNKEDWKIHNLVNLDDETIDQDLLDLGTVIVEKLYINKRFYIERRFGSENDKWHLIYYGDFSALEKPIE